LFCVGCWVFFLFVGGLVGFWEDGGGGGEWGGGGGGGGGLLGIS